MPAKISRPPSDVPWWRTTPALVVAGLSAVGAIGTGIVKSAAYVLLPDKLEAVEQTNARQDDELDDLKGWAKEIQGFTRAMQQQTLAVPVTQRRTDRRGRTWCCDQDCDAPEAWTRCPAR